MSQHTGRPGTIAGAATLVAVLATMVTGAILVGDGRPGRLEAIGFAAGVCLAGSLSGWLVGTCPPADPARAVALGLGAVFLRIFPALAALAWLRAAGHELRQAGAGEWLLFFYLTLLATDILLHMMGPRGGGAEPEN